jgi:hypothetical protein
VRVKLQTDTSVEPTRSRASKRGASPSYFSPLSFKERGGGEVKKVQFVELFF